MGTKRFLTHSIDEDFIENTCGKISYGIDIVIDTGGYKDNRIHSFESLFKKMNPGGIYVLEDLREDYNKNELINYLKNKIDNVNFNGMFIGKSYEDIIYESNRDIGVFEKRIAAIHFYMGVCFVFKRYCK